MSVTHGITLIIMTSIIKQAFIYRCIYEEHMLTYLGYLASLKESVHEEFHPAKLGYSSTPLQ